MMSKLRFMLIFALAVGCLPLMGQRRRATPIETPATMTQAVNETASDTARINARRRAASTSYVDERGLVIYVDTLTNVEWTDSTLLGRVPKMEVPLLYAATVGVDAWDGLMRAFGQRYGLVGVTAQLNMHNRYLAAVDFGIGQGAYNGNGDAYSYRSPLACYFRVGMDYNFLYNSNPDYIFTAGFRYGISPFTFAVDDIRTSDPYWGETGTFSIPSHRVFAGWVEVGLGLRVRLWGAISAGWTVKYHSVLHLSGTDLGQPWYIPGYGSRNGAVTGAVHVYYTIPLSGHPAHKAHETGPGL